MGENLVRLDYQPLFGKGACAPLSKFFPSGEGEGEKRTPDIKERWKSSLESSPCILLRILYSHTNGGSLCGRKHTKETQVGGRLL